MEFFWRFWVKTGKGLKTQPAGNCFAFLLLAVFGFLVSWEPSIFHRLLCDNNPGHTLWTLKSCVGVLSEETQTKVYYQLIKSEKRLTLQDRVYYDSMAILTQDTTFSAQIDLKNLKEVWFVWHKSRNYLVVKYYHSKTKGADTATYWEKNVESSTVFVLSFYDRL